jgi:hypothetical protein
VPGEADPDRNKLCVMAGLDPAIHLLRKKLDRRVKPGDDGGG